MSYTINKTQARTIARADLTIFNETQAIMKQVITDAGNGLYETTISDGTTITESTPTIVVTGSVANPTITATPTYIAASTINDNKLAQYSSIVIALDFPNAFCIMS